jgi:FkbM family methyltransferase
MRQHIKHALKQLGLYGIARQVATIYWRKRRTPKMRAFYRQFIKPNDLVFDVGANIGRYTAIFLALGARVLAIEPQADCMAKIKARFGKHQRVAFYQGGVAAQAGELELNVCSVSTCSSFSSQWIEHAKNRHGFEDHRWYATQRVPVTTLDALIAQHGLPAFIKIDVEGYELPVLQGLSQPVAALSFEYSPELLSAASACMAHLQALGDYEFNTTYPGTFVFMLPSWTTASALEHLLANHPSICRPGDLYARLRS